MGRPNPQNLKPAKKGEVRNPAGRPKGSPDKRTILKNWLELEESVKNPITGESQKLSQIEIVLLSCLKEARGGNMQAIKELFDRYFGKEKEQIDHTTNGKELNTLPPVTIQLDPRLHEDKPNKAPSGDNRERA